ncbi:hypothetical protein SOVF_171800 [Spinacia oleracea]|nr:hypothetical protein SOVF_171800 [Spinacia oleracea]
MNEVFPLCGIPKHSLDACPRRIQSELHLIVERLHASNLDSPTGESSDNVQPPPEGGGRWIKVTLKKRFRNPPPQKSATINQPNINIPRQQTRPSPTPVIPDAPAHINVNPFSVLQNQEPRETTPMENPAPLTLHQALHQEDKTPADHDDTLESDDDLLSGFSTPPVMEYGSHLPIDYGELSEGEQLFMETLGIQSPSESSKRRRCDDTEDSAASKSNRV